MHKSEKSNCNEGPLRDEISRLRFPYFSWIVHFDQPVKNLGMQKFKKMSLRTNNQLRPDI